MKQRAWRTWLKAKLIGDNHFFPQVSCARLQAGKLPYFVVIPFHMARIQKWWKIFKPCFTVTTDRLGESG